MTWCTDIYAPHSYGDWLIARQFSSTLFNLVDSMIFWQSVGCSLREMLMCEPYVMTIILFFLCFNFDALSQLRADWFACQQFIKINLIVNDIPFYFGVTFWPIKGFCCSFHFSILSLNFTRNNRNILMWMGVFMLIFTAKMKCILHWQSNNRISLWLYSNFHFERCT